MLAFPDIRLRRLRKTKALRALVRETRLTVSDLIYPIFVTHGRHLREPVEPMPGIYHLSLDNLLEEVNEVARLGIPGILLFGIPSYKDSSGSESYDDHGIIQEAIRVIKHTIPDLIVITDVCMCQYTDHGHCGMLNGDVIDNDATLEIYSRIAISHAEAGADIIAPSGMMDGQVKVIRKSLDDQNYPHVPIMAYSAKHASSFYGPFRIAADSTPRRGDRLSYQIDYANSRMALREIQTDIEEGADIVMIKPALPYLDVIARARDRFDHPIAAYHVSGEYSLIKAAAANSWINEREAALESLTGIRRAGADIIITYYAKDVASWLAEKY